MEIIVSSSRVKPRVLFSSVFKESEINNVSPMDALSSFPPLSIKAKPSSEVTFPAISMAKQKLHAEIIIRIKRIIFFIMFVYLQVTVVEITFLYPIFCHFFPGKRFLHIKIAGGSQTFHGGFGEVGVNMSKPSTAAMSQHHLSARPASSRQSRHGKNICKSDGERILCTSLEAPLRQGRRFNAKTQAVQGKHPVIEQRHERTPRFRSTHSGSMTWPQAC